MERFLLLENIKRFERIIDAADDDPAIPYIASLLGDMRRELAMFDATSRGAQRYEAEFGLASRRDKALLLNFVERADTLHMVIDPRAGLHIVDMTERYAAATLASRDRVAGHRLFEIFPDNPDVPDATGVANLHRSLCQAARSGQTDYMAIQRYDVRDAEGHYIEKYWRPSNTPILDDDGKLTFLLHQVEDVTARFVQPTTLDAAA
jgi:PAS domain-containing protein